MIKNLILQHKAHIYAFREPRGATSLPNYVAFQIGSSEDCAVIFALDWLNPKPVLIQKNLVAI